MTPRRVSAAGPAPGPFLDAVELLERSLGYTRGVLAGVTDADLGRPTPCHGWDLDLLLAHMDDALDAFAEAAGGRVGRSPRPDPGAGHRVQRLQNKACALLGAWSRAGAAERPVLVADHALPAGLLAGAAALEVAVHGWDVGEALGGAPALPSGFASALAEVADVLVRPEDRPVRFAPPLPVSPDAGPADRLLAHLGRPPRRWS